MKRLTLPSGATYGTDSAGNRVCTGSQMGRRNIIPERPYNPKLQMERLRFVDGCYDSGGAYWGSPANVYCAWNESIQVFVRGGTREHAKRAVRAVVMGAKFYR